jgi:hypothetical protein
MSLESLLAITPYPSISILLWAVLLMAVLYLARGSAHHVLQAFCQAVNDLLGLAVQAITATEKKLMARNHEVLLASGREAKERIIEREFVRIGDSVHRDLAGYPGLQRTLSDAITRLDEDHREAAEVPPEPTAWVKAVDVVAKLDRHDLSVGPLLTNIHESLVKAEGEALDQYRLASARRHMLLHRMMPQWRRIQQTLGGVNKSVESLLERSRSIDRHIDEYRDITEGTDRSIQVLSSSSLVHFFISGLVLAVAVAGAAINFSLIARPMAEMVGGTAFIGTFRTADIAALVIIMVEISMGLFLMESLRITRLFPIIGALPDKLRVRMMAVTFTILVLLASVEAGLAYMREILLQDELATSALLRGGETGLAPSPFMWITTAAQMGMGFTLPFALVFVAIPLEMFIHSLRTVLGLLGIGALRLLRLTLRLIGSAFGHLGTALVRLYDIPIFMPLWIEQRWRKNAPSGSDKRKAEVAR